MEQEILVIDAGTTSVRAMRFAVDGQVLGHHAVPLRSSFPRPGWVEQDPEAIWLAARTAADRMIAQAGGADRIAAIGIASQRETILFWDRTTGRPLGPAIVWQDRRSAALCDAMRERGEEPGVQARTGLLLDPYFSGSKIAWAMEHWPELRQSGNRLAIGTVESWLVWQLTNGLHVTDASNASRTALMALGSGQWDDGLLDLFDVPRSSLGEIVDNAGEFGRTSCFDGPIPITALVGDQQAALIGQGCLTRGETKATYGTGAFVLANAGTTPPVSRHRMLATVAWQVNGRRVYALEGAVFVAGSLIAWLRDGLGLVDHASDSAVLAASVPDNGGVYCVPALAGMGAPWWRPDARAAFIGMSLATGRAHLVRAALESMAYQTHDLMRAFAADGAQWSMLRVDGGMSVNDWMMQDLADMLDLSVERPAMVESTALGAAMLAAVGVGRFATLADAAAMRGTGRRFEPGIGRSTRLSRLTGWSDAVDQILAPAKPDMG